MTKMTKFLLPISAIAATTTAMLPLFSCGTAGETFDLETYEPTIAKKEGVKLTEQAATEALFGQENSLDLVKQDILYWLASSAADAEVMWYITIYLGLSGYVDEAKTLECTLSNLSVNYESENHIARLSGTIVLRATCDMHEYGNPDKKIGEYELETKHEIHNLGYRCNVTSNGVWGVYWPNGATTDTSWYVDRSFHGKADYINPKAYDEEESGFVRYSYINVATSGTELNLLYWSNSYYLGDCTA